jgi:hypothetical protein
METVMTKVRTAFAGALVAGLLGALPIASANYEPTAQQRSDCMGDTMRLCWSEVPNTSRIIACLSRQKSKVSQACRVHFDRAGR